MDRVMTNGFVIELYCKYVNKLISLDALLNIVSENCTISVDDINAQALVRKLRRLKTDDAKKRGQYRLKLRQEVFLVPRNRECTEDSSEQGLAAAIATDLANVQRERRASEEKAALQYQKLLKTKTKIISQLEERRAAAKSYQERAKQFKRKLDRLQVRKESTAPSTKQTGKKHEDLKETLRQSRAEQNKVKTVNRNLRKENEKLAKKVAHLTDTQKETECKLQHSHKRMTDLKADCTEHLVSLDYTLSLLEDSEEVALYDTDRRCFSPQCLECIINLDDYNVSNHKIPSVIQEVLKLVGKHPNRLPGRTTVDNIVQSKGVLARKQLSAVLPSEENTTLYTDETRKFSKSYNTYIATTADSNVYLLGLREMSNKSAQTCLDTFKEILDDISASADNPNNTECGKVILLKIKNTMSDRAQTEVAFNRLLEEYRKEILPGVHDNWHLMNQQEQEACAKINTFFCGLHLLVSFAEMCAASILKFETAFASNPIGAETDEELKAAFCFGNDAACIRVIRAASKCFSRGGDEKSGCFGAFRDHCESNGEKVRFVRFRGNRFNIVFLLAQITFYHRQRIVQFLENVHGAENNLQRAILADIKVPLVIAGCKVLGLISKLVTAPLWRVLEAGSKVLDLNAHYRNLTDYFKKMSVDASPFLNGTEYPFEYDMLADDEVLKELCIPNEAIDTIALPMCQAVFLSLHELLSRMAADQLPGGAYWNQSETLITETQSVVPHNKLPEFVFGQLDFLLRYRPNATTLTNESFLMYAMNKTGQWLDSLPSDEKTELLKSVRGDGRKYKLLFKERCQEIQAQRIAKLKQKEKELQEKKRKLVERKEKLTGDIIHFGLWQSEDQVEEVLRELSTEKERSLALTTQLKFRKTVLCQHADKELFLQGSKGENGRYRKHSSEKLKENVIALIKLAHQGPTVERVRRETPLLVGKTVRHTFEEGSWDGKVISVVPGYIDWYNIVYHGDSNVYTYRLLEDYREGNLEILAYQREDEGYFLQTFVEIMLKFSCCWMLLN